MEGKDRLIRRAEVLRRIGIANATLYRWIKAGRFPAPIEVGPLAVRWWESEVDAWLASRPRSINPDAKD